MKRTGFTLVELLVVVAIIALLIGILIPGLSGALEASKRAVCLSNHRTLATAVVTYSVENDGHLPAPGWDGGTRKDSHPDKITWLYDVTDDAELRNLDAEQLRERVATGSLWPYTQSREVYRCPLDEDPYRTREQLTSRHKYPAREMTSYTMNGALAAFGDFRREGHLRDHPVAKASELPGNALIIWATDENGGAGYWNDGSNHPGEVISKRHNEGATASSIDGSGVWITIKKFNQMRESRPGPLWFAPTRADGT